MEKGRLIVFEGACDGIGKSTQIGLLRKKLEAEGKTIAGYHFPAYGTYHGAPVEAYLRGDFGKIDDLSPYFINSLYAVDRACAWHQELKPLYESGQVLLLDRYTTSSLIYQAAKYKDIDERKKFLDFVVDFEYNKLGIKEPDTVIFLYAPFDMITKLRESRTSNEGIQNDLHERDIKFMREAYDNAMFVAEYLSWDMVQCNDEDKMRSREDIHEEINRLVRRRTR